MTDTRRRSTAPREAVTDAVDDTRDVIDDGLDEARERFEEAADDVSASAAAPGASCAAAPRPPGAVAKEKYEQPPEGLRHGYERVRKDAAQLSTDVNEYVRENPGKSILIAAGVGFVIGLLVRGRRRATTEPRRARPWTTAWLAEDELDEGVSLADEFLDDLLPPELDWRVWCGAIRFRRCWWRRRRLLARPQPGPAIARRALGSFAGARVTEQVGALARRGPRLGAPVRPLLHLSDVHFGPKHRPGGRGGGARAGGRGAPDLVVVSGDLTQRAKPRQFRAARRFVDRLAGAGRLRARATTTCRSTGSGSGSWRPFGAWRRHFDRELEPALRGRRAPVVGGQHRLRLDHQARAPAARATLARARHGGSPRSPAERCARRRRPPSAGRRRRSSATGAGRCATPREALAPASPAHGVELVLSGHLHQAS